MSEFCLISFFEISGQNNICIIVTHMKAREAFEAIRFVQMKQILEHLNSESFLNLYKDKFKCKGMLFCGDFNTEPTSESIKLIENYKHSENLFLNSFAGEEITTYKIRDKVYARVIDYIWNNGFDLTTKNKLMNKLEIGELGLPSFSFPSDHLFLKAGFKIK